ncbi:Ig-like domain-containing protein [Clostridium ganghwense]|uniref:Ig-like domain-containing protein n=1 Tax=Clostridium ganghwense TaxID=312089 RepID=UPI003AEF64F8
MEEHREYVPKEKVIETNKVWTIKFNKNIDLETLKGVNIFVVDSNDTIVDIKVSYDKEKGAIRIIPIEGYLPGNKYTLFISNDIKSNDGDQLQQATKVQFEAK